MRYLGLDYGDKIIGVALSDEGGAFAFPKENIANDERAVEYLARIALENKVSGIIVGDTRADNGADNRITAEADAFIKKLSENTAAPISTIREAWSTFEAARYAPQGQKHDDAAAAAIILQRYLDGLPKNG